MSLRVTQVPQGSILRPLLFLIYVNDIIQHIPIENLIAYADDTTAIHCSDTVDKLEIESYILINLIVQYFQDIGMSINFSKTQFINFNLNNSLCGANMFIEDTQLEEVTATKFLGVIVDDKLNWANHIDKLAQKLAQSVFIIRQISKIGNKRLSITCYYSFFYSNVTYSIILWGSSSLNNINRIFKLQKKAIRSIVKVKSSVSCKDFFIQNKILTVPSIYILEVIMYVKEQNTLRSTKPHDHNTRHNNFATQHRLTLFEKKPSYIGCKYYEKIPKEIKNIENKGSFKNKLVNWLVEKCFYSTKEFLEFDQT